ncbi:MAG: ketopantoate reductase family protein [Thermomicrobiales bacterium]
MKFVIVGGAGAMGGVWASRLQAAGHDVAILDVSAEAIAAINRDGLTVEQRDGSTTVCTILATDDAAEIGEAEAVIFFTKAHHTAAAAERAKPAVGAGTTVISLQNGWGNSDTLAAVFPSTQLAMGVSYHSASLRGPGRVAHTADSGPTYLGPYREGDSLARAQAVGDAMSGAGIRTTVTADTVTEIWKKLILNCATLPTAALTRLYTGTIGSTEAVLQVSDTLATEATAVAKARGLKIDAAERRAFIRDLIAKAGRGKASMLQDVEARRKTEIEVVNGAIVREGGRLGVATPLNEAMVALVNGLEASWLQ